MVRPHRMVVLGFMAMALLILLAVVITQPTAAQDTAEAPSFQQTADNPEKTTALGQPVPQLWQHP